VDGRERKAPAEAASCPEDMLGHSLLRQWVSMSLERMDEMFP
jgi:hypothetical protein